MMAIAEHDPSKLYAKNRGVLKMSLKQLHDFAATRRRGLPMHVKKPKAPSAMKPMMKPPMAKPPMMSEPED
jgi:hypothetical protein